MWWFAVIGVVPFSFSLGFLAGRVVMIRRYESSLEAVLTADVIDAGLVTTDPAQEPVVS